MTCQWCVKYRRRNGVSMCLKKDDKGNAVLVPIKGLACEDFTPRRSCTTCEHRCPPEDRERLLMDDDGCKMWELRKLSTWGGSRRYPRK